MNRLQQMAKNAYSKPKNPHQHPSVPEFDVNGKAIKVGDTVQQKRLKIAILIFLITYVVLYMPGLFMRGEKKETNNYATTPDSSTIKVFKSYRDKNKTQDFDGDGIDNATELAQNINAWDIDTDQDGVSDYYEIYMTKTSPSEYDKDILEEMQKQEDKDKGVTLDTPYKCGNVILWASDYTSKARGGVIETPLGYHFTNFKGYAQLPHDKGMYAYSDDTGEYKPLKYDKESDAWEIDGNHNVVMFDKPLQEVTAYSFFGKKFYFPHNFLGSIMTFLLPKYGWLTAQKTTIEDVEPTSAKKVLADNFNITYDVNNGERFKQKTNSLKDLQFVRAMIDSNKCVAVSLFNSKDGEIIGIIYGYDDKNNLYVADKDTHEPLGVIKVDVIGEKAVSYNGSYGLITYFKWYGLGYNSEWHNNISFFAVADEPSNLTPTMEGIEQTDTAPTPTDASENDAIENNASANDAPYDPDTDENYELPTLYTGNWNHTKDGFINIINGYNKYTDNTEEEQNQEYYKTYIEQGTARSFVSMTNNGINITYFWVSPHIEAKPIYDALIEAFKTENSITEEIADEVYKETRLTEGDYITIIRRYTDDTFIIITSDKGINEELQQIIDELGNTITETE